VTCVLTDKELFVARLVADGLQNNQIAVLVGQSEDGVKNRMVKIFDKLGFNNRLELALWYVKNVEYKESGR
jgi:DNA-binding NarL/FixJ family response regulator